MNSEAEQLMLRRKAEDGDLEIGVRRSRALQRLKLKTVIKASHWLLREKRSHDVDANVADFPSPQMFCEDDNHIR